MSDTKRVFLAVGVNADGEVGCYALNESIHEQSQHSEHAMEMGYQIDTDQPWSLTFVSVDVPIPTVETLKGKVRDA